MSFEDNFCASPWFHMRINNQGHYEYCRWAQKNQRHTSLGINDTDPITWFQHKEPAQIRQQILQGHLPSECQECRDMERHGKVSGRQKQSLKIGIGHGSFDKQIASSPWLEVIKNSTNGITNQWPQDWQIDLGNFCNSACVFCSPESSSRLAAEFRKLQIIDQLPTNSWCDDTQSLDKFTQCLSNSQNLAYLHFIGGETLITPAFKVILQKLIDTGINQRVSIGFTTNLACWEESVIDMLKTFKQVNLGMSVECLHPVNDYVRYGSSLAEVKTTLNKWIALSKQYGWLNQLRVTPTALSILHLDTIYEYAWQNKLAVESCNFLDRPSQLRPTVLPREYRLQAMQKIQNWINDKPCETSGPILNSRSPDLVHQQMINDAKSYLDYLDRAEDESHRLPELVSYLKLLESSRGNKITNYLPEYESLLRQFGY